jgi:glycosyltransferase involved in cell wall biosynthesis
MVDQFGLKKNAEVIWHGADASFLEKEPLPERDRFFTLMLGGESLQKNPTMAIKAWARVDPVLRKKFPLKIVGFSGKQNSPIQTTIRKYKLENEVAVYKWVSDQDILNYFRQARLFLFPSLYEGFGFPLLQAMATGTPVITTNQSSIPEIMGSVGFQIPPSDYRLMSKKIQLLLNDSDVWNYQARISRKRAIIFNWQKSAEAHRKVYKEILCP